MKYKIAFLVLLFLACSKTKPEPAPEYDQDLLEKRLVELQDKICEQANKVSIIEGGHSRVDYREIEKYSQLKMRLWELSQFKTRK